MIIKLIPEKGDNLKEEVEFKNVQDYFIFGNRKDEDGDVADFHEWKCVSYRYLLGSLAYFTELVKEERINTRDQEIIRKQIELSSPSLDNIEEVEAEVEVEETTENAENAEEADNVIHIADKIENND